MTNKRFMQKSFYLSLKVLLSPHAKTARSPSRETFHKSSYSGAAEAILKWGG